MREQDTFDSVGGSLAQCKFPRPPADPSLRVCAACSAVMVSAGVSPANADYPAFDLTCGMGAAVLSCSN